MILVFTLSFADKHDALFTDNDGKTYTCQELVKFLLAEHDITVNRLESIAAVGHPTIYNVLHGPSRAVKPVLQALCGLGYVLRVGVRHE